MERLIIPLLLILLVSGCTSRYVSDDIHESSPEDYGEEIIYEKDGKTVDPNQILPDSMKPGMTWLKDNTPEDAVIMSWWDYGHAIRAYAGRATTVAMHLGKDPEEIDCDDCVSHEIIQDVAVLLLTESDSAAAGKMEKYGATYLYVHKDDEEKSLAFFIALDEEPRPLEGSVLGRALTGELIEGFSLAYEDDVSRIYVLEG
jgi:hypothetical protein